MACDPWLAIRALDCAGDIIGLTFGGVTYNVTVVDVKPLVQGFTAVNLIDTDCAVDFLPPLNHGEGGQRQASAMLGVGSTPVDMYASGVVVLRVIPPPHPIVTANSYCGFSLTRMLCYVLV